MNRYWASYILNPGLKEEVEKIFEGIGNGRKRELENWFEDKWLQLEFVKDSVHTFFEGEGKLDFDQLAIILRDKREQFKEFSELFIINQEGTINVSTAKIQIGKNFKQKEFC